ncbi:MAG: hypothetical protein ABI321_13955 [Polyangia bacterium]
MIRSVCLRLLVALLLCSAGAAHADRKADAHAAEARGDRSFGKAAYQEALDEYNASWSKYPKPYLLVRIADCQRLLDRPADALYNYQKYLSKVAKGTERKRAQQYVAELEPKVAAAKKAAADAAEKATVAEAAPAPQASDPESVPMSPEQLAKKQRQVDKAMLASETVSANHPVAVEPPPPGYDPANYVRDPNDPKIAPPPAHVYPPGYKPPVYRRWWPWTILGVGVAAGVAVGLGLAFGLPKFNSELPVGGPHAQALGVRF